AGSFLGLPHLWIGIFEMAPLDLSREEVVTPVFYPYELVCAQSFKGLALCPSLKVARNDRLVLEELALEVVEVLVVLHLLLYPSHMVNSSLINDVVLRDSSSTLTTKINAQVFNDVVKRGINI
ncbi:hypothetical protein PIB30_107871, partial [Stylosanthes scabra]|nr:hypothetical protein [Stylosanthes scabra]